VSAVITVGGAVSVLFFPRDLPQPVLFIALGTFACLTSAWKVTLPLPVVNGSTLSVSYAASLMALLLLGPRHAMLISAAGVWTQCTYKPKRSYPIHRSIFSVATAILTIAATSVVFNLLGGPKSSLDSFELAKPLVGAIATYFLVNTALIANSIALTSETTWLDTWRQEFLWSGASFMVAGTAGAVAAAVLHRGEHWKAVILIAPIYLTYRTYQLFAGRLDFEKRHLREIQRFHEETITALAQARDAERALAGEKERLALALVEMTKLDELRHQLLEREQTARASAEEANRLKDQFLAIVSHELRTPLNAILGWADMLRRPALDERLRERAIEGVHHGAKRQAQLIEDLLDMSRITSGKMRLERTLLDVRDTVRDALSIVQPTADASGVVIMVDAVTPVGDVYADGARLQQVFVNLLSNAVKFTPAAGRVSVSLRSAGDVVELRVSDTGKGIAPEFLPWVFEPFRQGDGSTTRVHAGLGLGLAIVKTLVEAHHGSVSARSAGEGRGATFSVRLPIAIGPRHEERSVRGLLPPPDPSAMHASLEGISVLLVDDDDQSREVAAAHLHDCRAVVLTASSAAQGWTVLEREHVDVLVSDIGMPDEDGYEFIRRVRAQEAERGSFLPAAALTAFARDDDRRLALEAGFQLHLPKPVDAAVLVSAVASLGRSSGL